MELDKILKDKLNKPKQKTEKLAGMLLDASLSLDDLILYAGKAKDPDKATCMEAIELATKEKPGIATLECLEFATMNLASKAPRVKWESARVIGNIASLYPDEMKVPVKNLLQNTGHPGTVVRWSAAIALGEIMKLKTPLNKELIPEIENILRKEEKNSIRKIYESALKKLK